jgi:hypothetical protein
MPDHEEWIAEVRDQAIAIWATRHLHKLDVLVTMDWDKHPAESEFGRETMAALGYPPAVEHEAKLRALCAEGKWVECREACVAFARRFTPISPWAAEDIWDGVPLQAPAWAA